MLTLPDNQDKGGRFFKYNNEKILIYGSVGPTPVLQSGTVRIRHLIFVCARIVVFFTLAAKTIWQPRELGKIIKK